MHNTSMLKALKMLTETNKILYLMLIIIWIFIWNYQLQRILCASPSCFSCAKVEGINCNFRFWPSRTFIEYAVSISENAFHACVTWEQCLFLTSLDLNYGVYTVACCVMFDY